MRGRRILTPLLLLLALGAIGSSQDLSACGSCTFGWNGSSGNGEGIINCPNTLNLEAVDSWDVTGSYNLAGCGPGGYDSTFTHNVGCVESRVVGSSNFSSTETFNASPSDCKWHYFYIRSTIICTDGGTYHMSQDSQFDIGYKCNKAPNGSQCP